MRSLDDPANPYRGQYAEWDRWLYEHPGSPSVEERRAFAEGELSTNWYWNYMGVSAEGFPIPSLVSSEQAMRANAAGQPPLEDCKLSFEVWGEMPPELVARWESAELALDARYCAKIPRWLADNPPKSARIWPDGCVTTHGALGSYDGSAEFERLADGGWTISSEPYYLYSPDGALVRQTAENAWEQELFPGDYDGADPLDALFYSDWVEKMFARGKARGWRGVGFENEYWTWYTGHPRAIVEVYDIDGTRYGPDFNLWARDANKFSSISGGHLAQLYALQQERGE